MPAGWRFQTNQIADGAIEVLWRSEERGGDFVDAMDLRDSRVTVVLGSPTRP